jgi:hypothetical protein
MHVEPIWICWPVSVLSTSIVLRRLRAFLQWSHQPSTRPSRSTVSTPGAVRTMRPAFGSQSSAAMKVQPS